MTRTVHYETLDYTRFTWPQKLIRVSTRAVLTALARVTIYGMENVPISGPLLVATNHLHIMDAPLVGAIMPRRAVVFAKRKWQRVPLVSWLLTYGGNAIYADEMDLKSLRQAIQVLRAGGLLGIAPEGTRSRTGGLGTAHPGIVWLATQTDVPILPMVVYGQEQSMAYWKRLRRVPIQVRVGIPLCLPHGRPDREQLNGYLEEVMIMLATMLPSGYRGVYSEFVLHEMTD